MRSVREYPSRSPRCAPHNQRYVQVPAAACDALRTRQGAAKAALVTRYLLCDDEKFGSRTFVCVGKSAYCVSRPA